MTSSPAYRPHTLAEFPQLTPQEMGQRVLTLIDSLKSADQLTLEHVQKVTELSMERVDQPAMVDYTFRIHLPDSGWYYGLNYREDERTQTRTAWLDFSNEADNVDIYHLPDMTPVCLDFNAYVAALERMGFEKTHDQYHDLGWVVASFYKRNDVGVQVRQRRQADQPDAQRKRACLVHISFG